MLKHVIIELNNVPIMNAFIIAFFLVEIQNKIINTGTWENFVICEKSSVIDPLRIELRKIKAIKAAKTLIKS
jgi:hypothetical protein